MFRQHSLPMSTAHRSVPCSTALQFLKPYDSLLAAYISRHMPTLCAAASRLVTWRSLHSCRQVAAVTLPVLAVAAKYLHTDTDPQVGMRTVTKCMHGQRRSGCRDLSANRMECYMLQRTDLCS